MSYDKRAMGRLILGQLWQIQQNCLGYAEHHGL